MQWIDRQPEVRVKDSEYIRLLGYPPGWTLSDRAAELAEGARAWYAAHGNPWTVTRRVAGVEFLNGSIGIGSQQFRCAYLHDSFQQAQVRSVLVTAVSAGPELEAETQRLWREEKPDEYFFLEVFGSAVVEQLITEVGAQSCAWAERMQLAVLPHYSPGYQQWDIADQPDLLRLIEQATGAALPGELSVLSTGALRPKKSQLALFGLSRQLDLVRHLPDLVPCTRCSFSPCQYRRAPFVRHADSCSELPIQVNSTANANNVSPSPAPAQPVWTVNPKALARWADQRLSISFDPESTTQATFLLEGTTCSNLGKPLLFEYHVKLGASREGFPILEQKCVPSPSDTGLKSMCLYLTNEPAFTTALEEERPLLGQPLHHVLSWKRSTSGANCHCERASRDRMWGIVLETIYYDLVQRGTRLPQVSANTVGAL